jgi:hypothetical protein
MLKARNGRIDLKQSSELAILIDHAKAPVPYRVIFGEWSPEAEHAYYGRMQHRPGPTNRANPKRWARADGSSVGFLKAKARWLLVTPLTSATLCSLLRPLADDRLELQRVPRGSRHLSPRFTHQTRT